jgi:heterodisulfide reductase subunit C2
MSAHENISGGVVPLAEQLHQRTGIAAARCYQCGKCSAGCPLAAEMDYPPSLIMRMLQSGGPELEDKVLTSHTIWLCLSCEACYTRCPMEIDIPTLMDNLRSQSVRLKKVNPKAKDIIAFHRSFLDSIKFTGRLYEVGLIVDYKTRTRHLLQDVLMAPVLFFKGKLGLLPHAVKDRSNLARIFAKTISEKEVKA